jgi:methyltransferase-like protein/2-polyprenyl-3-methyl-5-hydroxy-6-metoxy-1,4-benzoquinol methylase
VIDTTRNTYDAVTYPGFALPQAHPDRLATIATLFGMIPPDVSRSRVLEIGCGDGTHMIATALGLPDAECLGIDLAQSGIDKGRAVIRELGLSNVSLEQMSLTDLSADRGRFDFIIAHGLYSWVPADVRDHLMRLCAERLTPRGVAYVSYNAYPGSHMRDMMRQMMMRHVRTATGPGQAVHEARSIARLLAAGAPEPSPYRTVLAAELNRIEEFRDSSLWHDDLSEHHIPVYFSDFIAHAERHGLQYLAEADFTELQAATLAPELAETLGLSACSRLEREQYHDYFTGRRFRQTLLCHKRHELHRSVAQDRVAALAVASPLKPGALETGQAETGQAEERTTFRGPKDTSLTTDNPLITSALIALADAWPNALPWAEVLDTARSATRKPSNTSDAAADSRELGHAVLQACIAGLLVLHVSPPACAATPGQRPEVSKLARLQVRDGLPVTSLRHQTLGIDDPIGRHLLQLLDGTRDRDAIVDALAAFVSASAETPSTYEPASLRQSLAVNLSVKLDELANLALLTRSS